jgi:hypothetical protein
MTRATYIGRRCLACGLPLRYADAHDCVTCNVRAQADMMVASGGVGVLTVNEVRANVGPVPVGVTAPTGRSDPRVFTAYGAFELSSDNGTPEVAFDAETGNLSIRLRAEEAGAA